MKTHSSIYENVSNVAECTFISFREIFVRMFSIFHAVFQVAVKLPNSYLGVEKQLLNYNFF